MRIEEWALLTVFLVTILILLLVECFLGQSPYKKLWEHERVINYLEREKHKRLSMTEYLYRRIRFQGEWLEVQYVELHFDGSIIYVTNKGKVPEDMAEEVSNEEEKE